MLGRRGLAWGKLGSYFCIACGVAFVAFLLFFTPLGGYINFWVSGLSLLGGLLIIGKSLFDIPDGGVSWKTIGWQIVVDLG